MGYEIYFGILEFHFAPVPGIKTDRFLSFSSPHSIKVCFVTFLDNKSFVQHESIMSRNIQMGNSLGTGQF